MIIFETKFNLHYTLLGILPTGILKIEQKTPTFRKEFIKSIPYIHLKTTSAIETAPKIANRSRKNGEGL